MALNTHSIDFESGSSQYLTTPDNAVFPSTGDFTVEIWHKPESQPGVGTQRGFVSHLKGSLGERNFSTFIQEDSGNIQLGMQIGVTSGAITQALSDGTWYHIAYVYDGTANSCEIFFGTQASAPSSIGTISSLLNAGRNNPTIALLVGAIGGDSPTSYNDGLFDEVRFWNDKRTSTEIVDNYEIELAGNEAGLVFYLKLNNNLTDSGPNTLTFTNPNSAAFSTDVPFVGAVGPSNLKSLSGNLSANIKSFDGNLIANIKSLDGNS